MASHSSRESWISSSTRISSCSRQIPNGEFVVFPMLLLPLLIAGAHAVLNEHAAPPLIKCQIPWPMETIAKILVRLLYVALFLATVRYS